MDFIEGRFPIETYQSLCDRQIAVQPYGNLFIPSFPESESHFPKCRLALYLFDVYTKSRNDAQRKRVYELLVSPKTPKTLKDHILKVHAADTAFLKFLFQFEQKETLDEELILQLLENSFINSSFLRLNSYELFSFAIRHNYRKVLIFACNKNCDFNAMGSDPMQTPIHYAIAQKNTEAVKFLLEIGADLSIRDYLGFTPQNRAAIEGNIEALQLFLEHGIAINEPAADHYTLLSAASLAGKTEAMQFLISKGADINTRNRDYQTTPLHLATLGSIEATKLLIDLGAIINAEDSNHETPLHFSLHLPIHIGETHGIMGFLRERYKGGNSFDILEVLIDNDANMTLAYDFGELPFHRLCKQANNEKAYQIIDKVLDRYPHLINQKDIRDKTPLYYAVCHPDNFVIKKLLERGADPNIPCREFTPLCIATRLLANSRSRRYLTIQEHYLEAIKQLVSFGANVNSQVETLNMTPLDFAMGKINDYDSPFDEFTTQPKLDCINFLKEKEALESSMIPKIKPLDLSGRLTHRTALITVIKSLLFYFLVFKTIHIVANRLIVLKDKTLELLKNRE